MPITTQDIQLKSVIETSKQYINHITNYWLGKIGSKILTACVVGIRMHNNGSRVSRLTRKNIQVTSLNTKYFSHLRQEL